MVEEKNKMTLVVISWDLDKVFAAFTMASGAATMGTEVVMFFTFWGMKAIQKDGLLTGQSLFGRLLGVMNRGGLNATGPSRLNNEAYGLNVHITALTDLVVRAMRLPKPLPGQEAQGLFTGEPVAVENELP